MKNPNGDYYEDYNHPSDAPEFVQKKSPYIMLRNIQFVLLLCAIVSGGVNLILAKEGVRTADAQHVAFQLFLLFFATGGLMHLALFVCNYFDINYNYKR